MKTSNLLQNIRSGWSPIVVIAVTTLAITAISIYCLASDYFIIFQNLFYIPIIIACVYYTKRGFAFSIIIACLYFLLTIAFTRESSILLQAFVRVLIFVLVAGVITYLSLARKRVEKSLRRQHDDLEGLVRKRTAQLEGDIAESKRTDEALRESELKLQITIDEAAICVAMVGLDKKFLKCNKAFCAFLGYSEEEMKRKTIADITFTEDVEIGMADLRAVVAGEKKSSIVQKRYVRKDGAVVWGEVSINLIRNSQGQPMYFLPIIQDITERKQAEEERDRLVNLTNNLICIAGMDGYFKFVNPAWEKVLGYTKEELLAKPFLTFIHPEDHHKNDEEVAGLAAGKPTIDFENRYIHKNGSVRHVLWTATSKPQENVIYCIGQDITERKKAEDALKQAKERLVLATVSGGVGIWDLDVVNNKLTWDDQMFRLYGVAPDDFGGSYETWKAGVHPEDVERGDAEVQMALRGEKEFDTEFRVVWSDGTIHTMRALAKVERDASGKAIRLIGTNYDITERKKAEAALQVEKANLDAIFESSPIGMMVLDETTNIVMANAAMAVLAGCGMSDIMNHRPGNALRCNHSMKDPRGCGYSAECHICPARNGIEALLASGGNMQGAELALELVRNGAPQKVWLKLGAEPVLINGRRHLCVAMEDVTERKQAEGKLALNSQRTQALLKLNQMTEATLKEITDFVLEEAVRLTQSKLGYLAFLNEDESVLTMHSWSKSAMAECAINEKPIIYPVASTGLWGEAVRQRRPVITNDYAAANPLKKGYPQGHVVVKSHMNIPVFVGSRIVIVAGVGNKAEKYDKDDVEQLTLLMEGMWRLLERKRAEEGLQESETRLSAIFKNDPTGIFLVNEKTRAIYDVNDSALEAIGLPREEVVGKVCHRFLCPAEMGSCPICDLGQVVDRSERVLLKPDGTRVPILKTVVPIKLKGENYLLESFIDITDRKRAEEELRAASIYSRNLLETSLDPLVTISAEGRITDVNTATEKITGMSRKRLIGSDFSDYFTEPEMARAGYQKVFEQGQVTDYPLAVRHTSGVITEVLYNASVYRNEQGKVLGVFAAARDITERKKMEEALKKHRDHLEQLVEERTGELKTSEEKFRTVADFTYDWEYWIDADRRMLYVSPSCERVTGFPPEKFYKDPGFMDTLIHPEDRHVFEKHVGSFHLGKRHAESDEIEFRIVDRKGCTKWIGHLCTPVVGDNGALLGRRASNRDITESKHADEELKRRSVELQASNKELESFSYSVSHDLRAPLRTIDGFSHALLEDYDDKLDVQGKDYLRRVRASTQMMAQLIDDMLKLSRVTRTEMNIEKVNLTRIARSVIDELQKSQPERLINIKIADGLEDTADSRLMRVALENLLGNAWKFTGKQAEAVIEFGATKEGGRKVYFIRDNGAGFDMAYADKLFSPFQRLHTMEEYPGTGIGLATVRRIINRHGGRVWTEGQVGKGATFYFSLQG